MADSALFCTNCGQMNEANAVFCSRCGARQPVSGPSSASPVAATVPSSGVPAQQAYAPAATAFQGYAGFWLRFVAFIIDFILIGIVTWPLAAFFTFFSFGFHHGTFGRPHMMFPFFFGGMFMGPIRFVVGWLYWAGMESSSYQATLGKMAVGVKVTDMSGNRISFAQASGRYFGKILSSLIFFIGYIMAGFTERKQALHDMLAGTLVVKK